MEWKADEGRRDGDDKGGPVTALTPHQEAEECHKAADMSVRQPTSTLDRYEPPIHYSWICLYVSGQGHG